MAEVEVLLPKMGESVAEATITNWLKNVGDTVELEEPIVEIATDKVDSEVPSPVEGVLTKILFETDEVAQVGQAIAIISTEGEGAQPSAPATPEVKETEIAAEVMETVTAAQTTAAPVALATNSNSDRFYSPLVRSIAQTEGISMDQLETIAGTGQNGRVTKTDILAFIENGAPVTSAPTQTAPKTSAPVAAPSSNGKAAVATQIQAPDVPVYPGDEIVEMDRMRKMIADHMVMSKHVSPHVTSYVEADVTNIVNWRNKVKNGFESREGEKITFTPIFIEAVVKAIKEMPGVNVSVDGNKIIQRKNINIGMATALPSGNLIVPVIKNADNLNLVGITKQVNDLANRARNNKLSPDDIQGGTYTITNVGTFGNVMGTPIINQPQVAILAVGAIRKVPAVIETPDGDFIGIRHKMFLSHSYDHRVVDGALGGQFVRKVADFLESFDTNREL
ncbi:MAG: 2-oxo acid dehydrogenase subunit E2 [Crocinitomicaceae bacterium]|nr:2-oxo acid dehydrogenase subunit E2 [Crocinitomicaceae bacterium]